MSPTSSIALTFDDGPDPVWTPRILDALESAGALATFFVVAPLAKRHFGLLRRAADRGHEVALHCNRHLRHDRMSAEGILSDATDGLRSLRELGHGAMTWRLPWGVVTPDTEAVARELGLRLVGWTADSEDWRGDPATGMLGRLAPGIGTGAVVLSENGVPIERLLPVRVTTSPRLEGRASRGLSHDLARAALTSSARAPGDAGTLSHNFVLGFYWAFSSLYSWIDS